MIINIDDSASVNSAVGLISMDWFDEESIYADLRAKGHTNSPAFWGISTQLLADVSESLGTTSTQFLMEWNQRCINLDAKIMGYHCTCHSNKQVFIEKGILPLSEKTIKLSDDTNQTPQQKRMWEYRSQQSPGPWFLLSYKWAKKPSNHFCLKGPEILLDCHGQHINVDCATAVPLILHCSIPYGLLSEKDYVAFCILRAYFNFLDPEDELTNLFDGYSIDLKGKPLDPQYIVRIEEI